MAPDVAQGTQALVGQARRCRRDCLITVDCGGRGADDVRDCFVPVSLAGQDMHREQPERERRDHPRKEKSSDTDLRAAGSRTHKLEATRLLVRRAPNPH